MRTISTCFAVITLLASAHAQVTPPPANSGQPAAAQPASPPGKTETPRPPLDCTGDAAKSEILQKGTSRLRVETIEASWQPRDGRVRFKVTSPDGTSPSSINNLELAVCFGWPNQGHALRSPFVRVIERENNHAVYEAPLPEGLVGGEGGLGLWGGIKDRINFWQGKSKNVYAGLGFVPAVNMHITGRSQTSVANDPNALDATIEVGISSRLLAAAVALGLLVIAWRVLIRWAAENGVKGSPILRVITNKNGYASLSQFQIVLWTAVIGTGLVYVMMLSGSLIDVPEQELALLGISGFSALSAKFRSKQKEHEGTEKTDDQTGGGETRQGEPPDPNGAEPIQRTPRWSDLVIWYPEKAQDAGRVQLDIARVQMLLFTVLAAGFVAMKIVDDNVMPAIPDGIVLLMGLTNGVYIGGKFVTSGQ